MKCSWCKKDISLEEVGRLDSQVTVCEMCLSLEYLGVRRGGKQKNEPWIRILGEQVAKQNRKDLTDATNDT
jgi:hypothetical protein